MNRQQIREIAETAFKTQFSDVEVVRVDVKERLDHDEDPVVDVGIVYDGKYKQLNGTGLLRVQSDIISKAWQEVEDDIGSPPPPCTFSQNPPPVKVTQIRYRVATDFSRLSNPGNFVSQPSKFGPSSMARLIGVAAGTGCRGSVQARPPPAARTA